MLSAANATPDLPVIQGTTDVIGEISRQSIRVASLIHEYTKLPWAGNSIPPLLDPIKSNDGFSVVRTFKIQISDGLKSRIDECRKKFADLKDKYHSRLTFDTNTQVKEIRAGVYHNGTFLLAR